MYHSFSQGVGLLEEYCGWVWTENFQWWFWMEAHIQHWEWMLFLLNGIQLMEDRKISQQTLRPCQGGGGSHVARLNFKTSCVGVYKCLLLIVSFAVTVAIWPREVVSHFTVCRYFFGHVTCWNLPWQGLDNSWAYFAETFPVVSCITVGLSVCSWFPCKIAFFQSLGITARRPPWSRKVPQTGPGKQVQRTKVQIIEVRLYCSVSWRSNQITK